MFTGLIKDIGTIKTIKTIEEGLEITISSEKLCKEIAIDDSVALDGVCQTAVSISGNQFTVQAIGTTLLKTTFKNFKQGYPVNLELALRASDRLGGHMVQGHVNCVSELKSLQRKGDYYQLEFSLAEEDRKYVIKEGSIAINGISLTVSDLSEFAHSFTVSIIPHTYKNTNLMKLEIGSKVNIEFDVISKYVENMLKYANKNTDSLNKNITNDWLSSKGF